MSQGPTNSPLSNSPPRDERQNSASSLQSRTLPPIQSSKLSRAPLDGVPRAQTTQNVSMRPTPPPSSTPPDQRSSRPIGVQNLLNPAGGDTSSTHSRQSSLDHADDSPRSAPMRLISRSATPSVPTTSVNRPSAGNVTLPTITPPLMNAYPQPAGRNMAPTSPTSYTLHANLSGFPHATIDAKQSPFVLPRDHPQDQVRESDMNPASQNAYMSSMPPARSPPRHQFGQEASAHPLMQNFRSRTGSVGVGSQTPASQSMSPSSQYSSYTRGRDTPPSSTVPMAPTGQPTSFFSAPFGTSGPASSMPPTPFDKKAFDVGTSGATGQNQYQMMTLETDQGPIQVPVDVQAASKVADEKRKRNATASHRFRQRRKEKEQETSTNIAKLEAQVREMTEEKEHYQRERDFLNDVIHRHRLPLPPRPPTPGRRRHVSLGGAALAQPQESELGARNEGRKTRRRTSAYVPAQGPPPQAEPPPPMPSLDRMPSEHLQAMQNRMRHQGPYPPGSFPPSAGTFDPSAPR